MSRAFTKEIDDAPAPPVPEHPISAARNLVTANGARQIEQMVAVLTEQVTSTSDSDVLAGLKRDLRYWEARRASMEILEPGPEPASVRFGTRVSIRRSGQVRDIRIVGEDEADPSAGTIAWTSPLARALEGAAPGDMVEFEVAGREEEIAVLSINGAG
ncbi:GreA/GreB family elongation factor [Pararhizobium sp. YC-54]|uniref:GreA/GreB family elongation factor n=1 Tax=Pararhizobium sp. YC-54 TaxID=2986920 RepID=UPI0021F6CD97|nr:GreA/GreB family elongation factor [Pararhizobium sp. YC-54]MCW0000658.1 GreA/GreB family elongation factor [Pararhizobium sp. YC-54]